MKKVLMFKTQIEGYKAHVSKIEDKKFNIKYFVELEDYPGICGGGETLEEAMNIAAEGAQMLKSL